MRGIDLWQVSDIAGHIVSCKWDSPLTPFLSLRSLFVCHRLKSYVPAKYHFNIECCVQHSILKKGGDAIMVHRTRKMTFRLTDEEYKRIKAKVDEARISQQQFLLNTALNKEIVHIKEFQELIFQIKKIGINVNQIAKRTNETGHISEADMEEVKGGLEQIWQLLSRSKIHIPA